MSSSKIQEYNLDPNCGFAKEDTAQEILGKVVNGIVPSFRSPVSMKYGWVSKETTASVSGTGKGVLTISGTGQATLTVDGVTIYNKTLLDGTNHPFTIEFKSSFVVTETYGNRVYYTAVFY